jgi:hypothetical protein
VIALGAIVSLCYIPGWTGAAIATQYAVLSAILPFTLWRQGPLTPFHWAGIALVAYAALSLAWNTDTHGGVYGLWLLSIMALTFWLGSTLPSLRQVYVGLAIGGIVSSIVAMVQAIGYQPIPSLSNTNAGIYFNTVAQGEILALLFIALLTERMFYLALPLVPGILLSQSRGAWMALMIGVAALFVRRTWLLIPLVMLGMVAIWFPSSSDVERLKLWAIAWNELSFFGNGIGSFASQIYNDNGKVLYPEFVHNDILQLAYEFGIAALLPATIFAFALSRTGDREWPVLMAFVTMGFYSFPLWVSITSFLGVLVTGRIVRSWYMDGRFSDYCGYVALSRLQTDSRQTVSLVSANKGSC